MKQVYVCLYLMYVPGTEWVLIIHLLSEILKITRVLVYFINKEIVFLTRAREIY